MRLEFLFSLQIIANASFRFEQVLNKAIFTRYIVIVKLKTKWRIVSRFETER